MITDKSIDDLKMDLYSILCNNTYTDYHKTGLLYRKLSSFTEFHNVGIDLNCGNINNIKIKLYYNEDNILHTKDICLNLRSYKLEKIFKDE